MMFGLFIFFFGLLFVYNFYWKRRNLPPGPTPLPLIGNLGSIASPRPKYQIFLDWSKKYNGLFTVWLGELPVVAICDYKLIQSAFVKDYAEALSGRFQFVEHLNVIRGGIHGIIEIDGDKWREQRRFILQVLRDFGFGKNLMQEKILVEVGSLLKQLEEDEKTGICDIIGRFDACIGSVINNLLFGYSFEGSKLEEFRYLKQNLQDIFIQTNKPQISLYANFPWLKHVPYFQKYVKELYFFNKQIFDFLERQIKEHEKNIDYNSETTDFCEAFLKEIHHQEKIQGLHKDNYSFIQLKNICFDLWIAGMETTATTCQFTIIYLLNHPNVLRKVQEELDSMIDNDRLITMEDKSKLHYLQAVISEVQRNTNLLLLNLFHKALDDVVVNGQLIKKGTIVVPQISCVLYDEKFFPDPFVFKPERFLDSDGTFKPSEYMIPFSIGKRSCLGESLARMELFLVLANVLKHFNFYPEKDGIPPSMEKKWGVTVQPEKFKVRVHKRF